MEPTGSRSYILGIKGSKYGPYTLPEVRGFMEAGRLGAGDYLWNHQVQSWVKVGESELAVYLESTSQKPEIEDEALPNPEAGASDPGSTLDHILEQEYKQQRSQREQVAGETFPQGPGPVQASSVTRSLDFWMNIPHGELLELAKNAEASYEVFPIQGRSKKRWIEAPEESLKNVQRKILDRLLKSIPLNGAAHGFIENRSILTHASNHVRKRWVINMDIRSFFPSVDAARIRAIAEELPIPPGDVELFVQLTTRRNHLPQGAPTSPALGNLVLRSMDRKMCDLVRGSGWFYTRYADDLTFSGFRNPRHIYNEAIRIVESEGFSTSTEKCRISGQNRRQMVTGIVVNRKLSLPREKRRMVRAMRDRLNRGEVEWDEMGHVLGWITFDDYVNFCDDQLPKEGGHVRPRVHFNKLMQIRECIQGGLTQKEAAKRAEVSIPTVARAEMFFSEMLVRSLATAAPQLWLNDDIWIPDSLGSSMLHAVAAAGRIAEVPPALLTRENLLRLDSSGRTVYGEATRAGTGGDLPEEYSPGSAILEQTAKLMITGHGDSAVTLANEELPDDLRTSFLNPNPGLLFPSWLLGVTRSNRNQRPVPRLRESLVPSWWYGKAKFLAEAASLTMPLLMDLDEEFVHCWMETMDEDGQTLLHYWVACRQFEEIPQYLRWADLLEMKNNEGENVFDVAEKHQNLARLPQQIISEWNRE